MSKYIIPFLNPTNWETNEHCELCSAIDGLYNDIIAGNSDDLSKNTDFLDRYYLVDGYNLLPVYEQNGYIIYRETQIEQLKQYRNDNADFMIKVHNVLYPNDHQTVSDYTIADSPTVLYSRWCKRCGSRKPDIYDPLRAESFGLLNIVNFKATVIDGKIQVTWRDSEATVWGKTKLFRDGEPVTEYIVRDKHETNPFEEILPTGIIYRYKVVNYDFIDEMIQSTPEIEVYVPVTENVPPGPCTNVTAKQVKKLYKEGDVYNSKDVILVDWTNPTDADFDGNVLRMGEQFFVPATETDGIAADKEMIFEDYGIQIDHTYYLKPFPYDTEKVKPDSGDSGYIAYRNYGYDSGYASIVIKQQCNNVSNLTILQYDGSLGVEWQDPEDGIATWKKALVILKEKIDDPIMNDSDGVIITQITERNKYLTAPYKITGLKNGKSYYIGVFPVNSYGLINVNMKNQIVGTPGYYVPGMSFDNTKLMPYMGLWKANDSIFMAREETLCLFEVFWEERLSDGTTKKHFEIPYGGRLSFEVKADGIRSGGAFNVYKNQTTVHSSKLDMDWTKVVINIPANSYTKFMFELKKGKTAVAAAMRNIKFDYNSY